MLGAFFGITVGVPIAVLAWATGTLRDGARALVFSIAFGSWYGLMLAIMVFFL